MARPLRIEYAEAVYHVTARGNGRRAIVGDDRDRDRWLWLLGRTVGARHWRVFAFALMDNHFHLFCQTPEANLSAGMRDLNGGYAGYFNARHRRSGHLFGGRFKAVLVESQGHWLEVSRYVHLNPVRAGLVARPEQWKWSSCRGYHRAARRLGWVDYATVLEAFGGESSSARRAYRAFVEEGLGRRLDSPLRAAVHGIALGSEAFLETVRRRLRPQAPDRDVPALARMQEGRRPGLERIAAAAAREFGCDRDQWRPGRRCDDLGRAVAAYAARRLGNPPARAIAEALGYRDVSSVSVACRRLERAMEQPRLARRVQTLVRKIATNH